LTISAYSAKTIISTATITTTIGIPVDLIPHVIEPTGLLNSDGQEDVNDVPFGFVFVALLAFLGAKGFLVRLTRTPRGEGEVTEFDRAFNIFVEYALAAVGYVVSHGEFETLEAGDEVEDGLLIKAALKGTAGVAVVELVPGRYVSRFIGYVISRSRWRGWGALGA
jgi:hypothetical protein